MGTSRASPAPALLWAVQIKLLGVIFLFFHVDGNLEHALLGGCCCCLCWSWVMQRGHLGAGVREGSKGTLYALGEQDPLWLRPGSCFMGTREWRCSLQDEPAGCLLLALMPSTASGVPGAGGALLYLFLEVPKVPLGSPLQTSVFFPPCAQVFLFHLFVFLLRVLCLGRESMIQPSCFSCRLKARPISTKELKGEEVLSER